jgi:low affinity Fe/Cu permease
MREAFHKLSKKVSDLVGTPVAFLAAVLLIVVWGLTGPVFNFSDTWQLVINTGTTIITFLMVFVIQNTQNRESEATQLKLDEMIRAIKTARNSLIDIEDLSDDELKRYHDQFQKIREKRAQSHSDDSAHRPEP